MLENDANCAALGEYIAANDTEDLLYITLGAGIGGGLVIGGQLYRGHHGLAGKIGHMTVVPDGLPCLCGRKGCFEQYASTSALAHHYEYSGVIGAARLFKGMNI